MTNFTDYVNKANELISVILLYHDKFNFQEIGVFDYNDPGNNPRDLVMFLGAVDLLARSDTTLKNKISQDLDTKITWNWYDRVVARTIEIMSR